MFCLVLEKNKDRMLDSRIFLLVKYLSTLILLFCELTQGCQTMSWRNMSMVERLFKSDIVLYGRDIDHGKFRLPTELDARFDVLCVIKAGLNRIPGQVIIKQINEGDMCSGVKNQMVEGREYIVGVERQLDGFMVYADINPLQQTAFLATDENFEILAAICELDEWLPPATGEQDQCPSPTKPRFCTTFRDPDINRVAKVSLEPSVTILTILNMIWILYPYLATFM